MIVDEKLKMLLRRVSEVISPKRERTLFDVGGRGYYENPTSDLLSFFLQPNEDHALGPLFLEAFLECLDIETAKNVTKKGITVHREVEVPDGGRMDLLLRGPDWVLVIENKIYHHQANPFASYAEYAKEVMPHGSRFLAVLSPAGDVVHGGWTGVSYARYCDELLGRLRLLKGQPSKWLIFAREFVLHIQTELYTAAMNAEQLALVDNHLKEFEDAQKLYTQYRAELLKRLPSLLEDMVPGERFFATDHGWAIRCRSESWGRSDLAYWYQDTPNGRRHQITVYLTGLNPEQHCAAQRELRDGAGMRYGPGRGYGQWTTQTGFENRPAAEQALQRLAVFISRLFPKQVSAPLIEVYRD